jgi:hypothetical protein
MGGVQVLKKTKHYILLPVFLAATNDIHCFGRAPASVGIAEQKERYVA